MSKIKITAAPMAILLIAVLLCGCAKSNFPSQNRYSEIYDRPAPQFEVSDDGVFTVFKINDTHFINGTGKNDRLTLQKLQTALDSTKFDLIIIDGDLIEGYNKKATFDKYKAALIFGDFIERYNTPWTFTPGNNDGQQDCSNEELIAFFMRYKNFLCGNEKDIDGAMQFFIDITQNGVPVHSIAVMDSLSTTENGEYDHIKQNQTDSLIKKVNSKKVNTSLFFHMPTPAFKEACENGIAYEGFPFSDEYAMDDIKANKAFDDAIADNRYISLISTAHVHSDNMAYFYNNRYYQLSSLGGYGAVGSNNTEPSYTLIKINVNAENVRDMYEFFKVQ